MRTFLLAAFLLTGCVTASSSMMGENAALISTKGMGWNESNASLVAKATKEAAKMAIARGFTHFTFDGMTDTTSTGMAYLPGNVTSNTNGTVGCFGAYCRVNSTTTTNGYGPRAIPVVRPGADIYVRFYRAGDVIPQGAFNASQVLAQK